MYGLCLNNSESGVEKTTSYLMPTMYILAIVLDAFPTDSCLVRILAQIQGQFKLK